MTMTVAEQRRQYGAELRREREQRVRAENRKFVARLLGAKDQLKAVQRFIKTFDSKANSQHLRKAEALAAVVDDISVGARRMLATALEREAAQWEALAKAFDPEADDILPGCFTPEYHRLLDEAEVAEEDGDVSGAASMRQQAEDMELLSNVEQYARQIRRLEKIVNSNPDARAKLERVRKEQAGWAPKAAEARARKTA